MRSRNCILRVVESVTDLEGNPKREHPYEGLTGFLGYVPLMEEGCQMVIFYPSDAVVRLTTTRVREYSFDEITKLHTVRTKNSIYTLRDYYDPAARKRAKATLYMKSPIGKRYREDNPDPEGHLLAFGRYRTKIYPQDLPDWYVGGYMYKRHGYMSAKGVKYLLYKPNYSTKHLFKDDLLFISYDKEITATKDETGSTMYEGYEHVLSGAVIVEFVATAAKYSGYDIETIKSEIEKKKEWYYEQFEAWE